MKEKLLSLCKFIFGLGFWISALSFGMQAYEIMLSKSSENVSFMMFILFTILNTNSILFGKYVVKDKFLMWGAISNLIVCIITLTLIQIYWYDKS